jgi:hypothetical protein
MNSELAVIEEQLDVLLGELEDGPGSSKDKVQYAITVTKTVLTYIDNLLDTPLSELHMNEEDVEHANEGYC